MEGGNFYKDNEDLEWQINNRCDFNQIFEWVPNDLKDTLGVNTVDEYKALWIEILNTIGEYSGGLVDSNSRKVSEEDLKLENGDVVFPPTISKNVETFVELGGPPLTVGYEFGGLSAPMLIEFAVSEMIARACPSTLLNVVWYGSIARIIEKFGSEEQKNEWVTKIATGECSGSMSLTEPDAGSDLANARTYGEKQEDGSWKITGAKQFISNGNGDLSLVLAKNAKGAKGLRSLNIYLVPRKIDRKHNFNIIKLEEKPGLHGSATCALEFNESVGYLIGENGEGFSYMLHLMNEARVAVAFQGLGAMEASYRLAKQYSEQRQTFGKYLYQHEMICEKLLDLEVELKGLRSISVQAAYYASLVELGNKKMNDPSLSDDEKKEIRTKVAKYDAKLREWTPLIKWWGGEKSIWAARESLMIHGGYGYTTEYRPELWVRESLIVAIYEGTSHIQALMAVKDTLKDVVKDPSGFVEILFGLKLKKFSEGNPLKKKVLRMRQILTSGIKSILFKLVKENSRNQYNEKNESDIMALIKMLKGDIMKFDDLSPALLYAERICEMKAIVAMARCLVWDAEKDPSRTEIAERFINKFTPQLNKLKEEIETSDPVIEKRIQEANS